MRRTAKAARSRFAIDLEQIILEYPDTELPARTLPYSGRYRAGHEKRDDRDSGRSPATSPSGF